MISNNVPSLRNSNVECFYFVSARTGVKAAFRCSIETVLPSFQRAGCPEPTSQPPGAVQAQLKITRTESWRDRIYVWDLSSCTVPVRAAFPCPFDWMISGAKYLTSYSAGMSMAWTCFVKSCQRGHFNVFKCCPKSSYLTPGCRVWCPKIGIGSLTDVSPNFCQLNAQAQTEHRKQTPLQPSATFSFDMDRKLYVHSNLLRALRAQKAKPSSDWRIKLIEMLQTWDPKPVHNHH